MAVLTSTVAEGGDNLVGTNPANGLTQALTDEVVQPVTSVISLMLMMRLRLHAAWLLFMLMPT